MANTPRYITKAQVRTLVGIESTQISDDDVDDLIYDVEFQLERYFNTTFTPKLEIEKLDGNGKNSIFINNVPLLAVRTLKDDTTSIDLSTIDFSRSGRIRLGDTSTVTSFTDKKNIVIVEYYYGYREFPTSGGTETTTSADVDAGSAVAISVSSETGFATNDWVEIYGVDGNREVSKVTGTATGTITVDALKFDHDSGSLVRKLEVPVHILRLMKVCSALAMVSRIVGDSADDIVGYTMGEFQVQKGEPYTQWRETALQLVRERDELMSRIQINPGVSI